MKENGLTPAEEFGRIERSSIGAENFHTWGCPVYVLNAKLQSGSIGPPKWESRGRVGIYLGHSPFHAGNVALVFNLQTGHVSPQYHVIFDEQFTTVEYLRSGDP